ncbi:MAG: tetratricopeptide repeat protein [bacterium]
MITKEQLARCKRLIVSIFLPVSVFFIPLPIMYPLFVYASPGQMIGLQSGSMASDPNFSKDLVIFEESFRAFKIGNLKEAQKGFEKLIFQYPESLKTPPAYLFLGEIYQKEGFFYEAMAIYNQFLNQYQDHPYIPEILCKEGDILFHLGRMEEAKKLFKRVVLQHPHTDQAQAAAFRLGDCLYETGDSATALLYYDEGMKKMPAYITHHPATAFRVGCLFMEDQRADQALEIFLTLEKNFPHEEFTNRAAAFGGDILREQGNIQEALHIYQRVIDTYAGSIGAQVSRMRMADLGLERKIEEMMDPNHAFQAFYSPISAYREIINEPNGDPDLAHLAEYKLGLALQREKNHEEAIHVFRSLLKKDSKKTVYRNSLHVLNQELINYLTQCYEAKEYLKTIKIYEGNKYLLDPFLQESADPVPYYLVASSYQGLGFYLPAIQLFEMAGEIAGSVATDTALWPQIHLALGQTFHQLKEYQRALQSLRKIIRKPDSPLIPAIHLLEGDIYREQGDFQRALDSYLTYFKMNPCPKSTEHLLKTAQCYQRLGKHAEGITYLMEAAESAKGEKDTAQMIKALSELAISRYKTKNYPEALRAYQELHMLPLNPEHREWVLFQIGSCLQKQAQLKEATDIFEKVKASHQDPLLSALAELREAEMSPGKSKEMNQRTGKGKNAYGTD